MVNCTGVIVAGPWMLFRNGTYYLFYSGGEGTWDPTYAVGVARSPNVNGPFVKACGPILTQVSSDVEAGDPLSSTFHCTRASYFTFIFGGACGPSSRWCSRPMRASPRQSLPS
jgi:beta-xylosidase